MKNKHTVWIALSLLAVFALGAAAGIFGERYFVHKKRRRIEQGRPHFPTIEMMAEELGLSPEQQERIRGVFQKNEERFKEMRSYMHGRLAEIRSLLLQEIKDVLDETQRQGFEAMIERYMRQRKELMERDDRNKRREPDKRPPAKDKGVPR